jgi:hypothetical protein
MKVFSFRHFRIVILLGILAFALIYTQEQKRSTTSWYQPVKVIIFPINGDRHPATASYIHSLKTNDFQAIDQFFSRSGREFNLAIEQPVITQLGQQIESLPPAPPTDNGMMSAILWSLKLRYWAYQNTPDDISNQNRIRLYVIYHQPSSQRRLAHSMGLQKGLIGVIHAFAVTEQNPQNAVVMAHEIMHTLGASDKYGADNQPHFPEGYAEPDKNPLYPQRYAEIMAGRIAVNDSEARMPSSLRGVRVGEITAREINWIQP